MAQRVDAVALKSSGLIRQTDKDFFVARLRVPAGNLEAQRIIKAAELAEKYGRGYCHFTFQQSIEIPWVKIEDLEAFQRDLKEAGLSLASCGPRVRAVTACSGCRINPYGLVDAADLARRADELFFGQDTPHKFKVSYSGCAIGCANPQENDLGFHGMVEPELVPENCNGCSLCVRLCESRAGKALAMNEETELPEKDLSRCTFCGECIYCCPTGAFVAKRVGHAVYVGGKHGRFPRWGNRVADFVSDDQTLELLGKVSAWYRENGKKGERIGVTLDRLGLDAFKKEVLGDRFKTEQNWDTWGYRPLGIQFRTLHTWDSDGS